MAKQSQTRRKAPKPFSEMTREEKIKEAYAAIGRLRHPHNRGMPGIYDAVRRWEETLKSLGAKLPD